MDEYMPSDRENMERWRGRVDATLCNIEKTFFDFKAVIQRSSENISVEKELLSKIMANVDNVAVSLSKCQVEERTWRRTHETQHESNQKGCKEDQKDSAKMRVSNIALSISSIALLSGIIQLILYYLYHT